jgi:predicted ATPase with chaperone activity
MSSYLEEALRQAAEARRKRSAGAGPVTGPIPQWTNNDPKRFYPEQPDSIEKTGLPTAMVEALALKVLFRQPGYTGKQISRQLCLHINVIRAVMDEMKLRKLVVYRGGTATGDFLYELSDEGREQAVGYNRRSLYAGPAPVTMEQYIEGVEQQSVRREKLGPADLERAFDDLLIDKQLLRRLGPAIASARGLFMHGEPGNGKTSIARRIARAFGHGVFIPHAVLMGGFVCKVFDAQVHREIPLPEGSPRPDARWVFCERPAVVAGGELTMDSLEIAWNPTAGVCTSPLQVKANAGILVIDDLGRQRIDTAELFNRWIVPMEDRIDYLSLPDGRKVALPFDPFLVFATNLNPDELVDEAFLRRIPYKIAIHDPPEPIFRKLLLIQAEALKLEVEEGVFDHLMEVWYHSVGRPLRGCHPRDLLLQVRDQCVFFDEPLKVTRGGLEEAARNYFIQVK